MTSATSPTENTDPAAGLDIADAPFSRRCHWLSLALRPETGRSVLYLRTARGNVVHRTLLRIDVEEENATLKFSPGAMKLVCPAGEAEFALTGTGTLRARLRGDLTLRLQVVDQPYSSSFECEPGRWHINLNASRSRLMITRLMGDLSVVAPVIPGKGDTEPALIRIHSTSENEAELEITEFESTWLAPHDRPAFDEISAGANAEFEDWLAAFGSFPSRWKSLARRAAFVLWANTAPAGGNYIYPAILMSRNAMISVWSWDHCFSALALAQAHPREAWEQWWLPFALQTPQGMLPDTFTESGRDFGMTKPPVHGWALLHLLPHLTLSDEQLGLAYSALENWTSWWFTHRDDDNDGIPQYNHGCESGWDNDSICTNGLPCEAPDLSVYLIQQYDALAELAIRLQNPEKAAHWQREADSLWQRLQAHSWRNGRWHALQSGSHRTAREGDCLRLFWPLLLGQRLDATQRKNLLAGLTEPGRFRTAHGFATEAINSPSYQADGYWLGPIWAPSTFQVVEMLRMNGRMDEADRVVREFCELCLQHGFSENFDALTGTALRDRGYSWTAAVCLCFLKEIL